ncbi:MULTISPECIES: NAD-dependent epimerase/dehydratase family protein [unclassified Oceanobacillus]|uniref:NAD-dependent epimerase/dehydratase family protein n=1 Tax=unclassified Oceanobacillus TaxID=2630292 RepID=UPI00300DEB07
MKVLVVGASGTIGQAVVKELEGDWIEIIKASRNNSDVTVDITSQESISVHSGGIQ